MFIRNQPPLHLTYCLNIHPGETWEENFAAIKTHALNVRQKVCPDQPFGLGLRLSRQAVETLRLPEPLEAFRDFLRTRNLYVFTVNGFPYGTFHGKPVKTEVYRPDWSAPERRDYTMLLAETLAALLPDGAGGSISTLPLTYKAWQPSEGALNQCVRHLADCTVALHGIRNRTGHDIHLGLEPEPDCQLETTDEVIRFFEEFLLPHGVAHVAGQLGCSRSDAETVLRRHIGVCFDTCHLAIAFEPLAAGLAKLAAHGIRISKIQLSSALELDPTAAARQWLNDFLDPVYLHQVKGLIRTSRPGSAGASPSLRSYPDLPDALATPVADGHLWRIHFHVPLDFKGYGELRSTAHTLDADFWAKVKEIPLAHLEIETYTFHVLPPSLRADGVAPSICREFDWVLRHLTPDT
jgi:sugar phosphate isomerase/epimerase